MGQDLEGNHLQTVKTEVDMENFIGRSKFGVAMSYEGDNKGLSGKGVWWEREICGLI